MYTPANAADSSSLWNIASRPIQNQHHPLLAFRPRFGGAGECDENSTPIRIPSMSELLLLLGDALPGTPLTSGHTRRQAMQLSGEALTCTTIEERMGAGFLPKLDAAGRFGANEIYDGWSTLTYTSTSDCSSSDATSSPTDLHKVPKIRRRATITTPYLRRDCAKVLHEWFLANQDRPYPSAEEKLELEKASVRSQAYVPHALLQAGFALGNLDSAVELCVCREQHQSKSETGFSTLDDGSHGSTKSGRCPMGEPHANLQLEPTAHVQTHATDSRSAHGICPCCHGHRH